MKRIPKVKIETDYIPFGGGLDLVTPMLQMKPGYCRDSQNVFHDINGGYRIFHGYERYSGQSKPSAASYATLAWAVTGTVAVGNVLTDNATTSYGTVLAMTDSYAVLSKIAGHFTAGNIKVGGVVVGTCSGEEVTDGATTSLLHAQYLNLAADLYRTDIAAVPGAGDILGIWYYDGNWYAFRNNAGATAAVMYKDSAAGWVAVTLNKEIAFDTGTAAFTVGETLSGSVSGDTATIESVFVTSGTWAGGTAAGVMTISSETGNFDATDVLTDSATGSAACTSIAATPTLTKSGRYDFVNHNFYADSDTYAMYGADGVNYGFSYDGTAFVRIRTGMTADTPDHVCAHKLQLFFSYGSQLQFSAPGDPYDWTILSGNDLIGMGDDITGFMIQPSAQDVGALAVYTKNSIGILYGNNVDDFILNHYKNEVGAVEWSMQYIGNTFTLDSRGIMTLQAAQEYGNFQDATVSQLVQPLIKTLRASVTASCISRDFNQYWIFFSDKTAFCCTIDNGEIKAIMPMLFEDKVTCACSSEDTSGNEIIMFGSDNGYVYQMYKGTSLDGDNIKWFFDLAYDHFKSPMVNKNFRRAMFEISGDGYAIFNFSYLLGYGSTDIEQPATQQEDTGLSDVRWDDSGATWDTGFWDYSAVSPEYFPMLGSAENMSIRLQGEYDYCNSILFSGAVIQYNYTRERR